MYNIVIYLADDIQREAVSSPYYTLNDQLLLFISANLLFHQDQLILSLPPHSFFYTLASRTLRVETFGDSTADTLRTDS